MCQVRGRELDSRGVWGYLTSMKRTSKHWTPKEDDLLTEYYPLYGSVWVADQLTNRTGAAVLKRAQKLGVKGKPGSYVRSPDDMPYKVMNYGPISITWTKGEWDRLCEVRPARDLRRDAGITNGPFSQSSLSSEVRTVRSGTFIYWPTSSFRIR